MRDSRIAMIFGGTNEIHAIELVQRKWLDRDGERLGLLLEELRAEADHGEASASLTRFSQALRTQIERIGQTDTAQRAARERDAEVPLRVAYDVLQGLGFALLAWAWSRVARAVQRLAADLWCAERVEVARFDVCKVAHRRDRFGVSDAPLARWTATTAMR